MTQVGEDENGELMPLKPSMMERHIFSGASKTMTGLEMGESRIERLAGSNGNTITYLYSSVYGRQQHGLER